MINNLGICQNNFSIEDIVIKAYEDQNFMSEGCPEMSYLLDETIIDKSLFNHLIDLEINELDRKDIKYIKKKISTEKITKNTGSELKKTISTTLVEGVV